jgi:hypothetical protein
MYTIAQVLQSDTSVGYERKKIEVYTGLCRRQIQRQLNRLLSTGVIRRYTQDNVTYYQCKALGNLRGREMARQEHKSTPTVLSGVLYTDDVLTGIRVNSTGWFDWLELGRSFYAEGATFRCEKRRNSRFWYAYKRLDGKLRKKYVGRSEVLTLDRIKEIAQQIGQ